MHVSDAYVCGISRTNFVKGGKNVKPGKIQFFWKRVKQ